MKRKNTLRTLPSLTPLLGFLTFTLPAPLAFAREGVPLCLNDDGDP